MTWATIAFVMSGAVPRMTIDAMVNRRPSMVIRLRPRRSVIVPTNGAVLPTAMICATKSQMDFLIEPRSMAITVKTVIVNSGITSATVKLKLNPAMLMKKENVSCPRRWCKYCSP